MKIAVAQMPIVMGDERRNVRTLFEFARAAARKRCDVAVFPECALSGWLAPTKGESIPGDVTERLSELAQKNKMAIVAGIAERDGGRLYNSAVLIDRRGRVLLKHRKINELEIGLRLYGRGESLATAEFEGRRVALTICADSWVPEITDALYRMGARIIFSPSAWAIDRGGEACNLAWIAATYEQRTSARDLAIVAPNSVGRVTLGPWRGKILQGDSLAFGPGGKKLLQGPRNRAALLTLRLKP